MAERLTPQTLDLEVQRSSLAIRIVSLDKELYSTLSLFTQVYKWVTVTSTTNNDKKFIIPVNLDWFLIKEGVILPDKFSPNTLWRWYSHHRLLS